MGFPLVSESREPGRCPGALGWGCLWHAWASWGSSALLLCWPVPRGISVPPGRAIYVLCSFTCIFSSFLFSGLQLEVKGVGWCVANTLEWFDKYSLWRRLMPLIYKFQCLLGRDNTPRDIGLSLSMCSPGPRASRVDTCWVTSVEMVGDAGWPHRARRQ